jgi:O-antigen ligase
LNAVLFVLLSAAIVWIQCLIGGTRLVFSLPPYFLLSAASLLTVVAIRKHPTSPRVSCLIAASLLGGYVAVRAAWSPTDYLWWPDFTMILACLMAYFLVALYLEQPAFRMALVLVLFALTIGELIPAFRQFSQGDNYMAFGFLRADSGPRASGFFISPNSLAGFLETIGIIAFSLACWMRWRGWIKGLTVMFACLCWLGVAVSGSRGGYLSTVFSWLVFGLLSLWVIRRLNPERFGFALSLSALGFVTVLIGAGLLMTKSNLLRDRLNRLGDQFNGAPSDVRVYNWQAAEDQFHLAPAFGTGAGTHLYYGRQFRRPQIQVDPVHAHNDYLELAAEYGLVGIGLRRFSRPISRVEFARSRPSSTRKRNTGIDRAAVRWLCKSAVSRPWRLTSRTPSSISTFTFRAMRCSLLAFSGCWPTRVPTGWRTRRRPRWPRRGWPFASG